MCAVLRIYDINSDPFLFNSILFNLVFKGWSWPTKLISHLLKDHNPQYENLWVKQKAQSSPLGPEQHVLSRPGSSCHLQAWNISCQLHGQQFGQLWITAVGKHPAHRHRGWFRASGGCQQGLKRLWRCKAPLKIRASPHSNAGFLWLPIFPTLSGEPCTLVLWSCLFVLCAFP